MKITSQRVGRGLLYASIAAMLLACGGSGEDQKAAEATGADGIKKAQSAVFTPTEAIPVTASVQGMFSAVHPWPLIPVHMVMLPDTRILTYGTNGDGTQTGKFIYDIWDPAGGLDGGHMTLPNQTPTDLFCSTQLVLPSGDGTQVFIGGGDNWNTTVPNGTNNLGNNNSNIFSTSANTLTPAQNMNRPRWYATSTTLVNGETLVAGGNGGVDAWEVRGVDGSFRLLNTQSGWIDWYYPRNFVRPDGKVIGIGGNGFIYNADPTGTGSASWLDTLPTAYTGEDTSVVMYRPGKLIQFGGNSNGALMLDIRSAEVGISKPIQTVAASLSTQRRIVTGTILANGQVLATGGSTVYNELTGVNYNAEIWDPVQNTWTLGATYALARLYHNVALLMPDGTVIVGGGGAPGPLVNTNFELYYPPYLFNANGTLAARPTIATAPTVVNLAKTFTMQVGATDTISRVVMIKTGSVTHGNNMEQRFDELPFTTKGATLTVQPPSRPGEATPGFYMLIAINSAGVPSVAKIVRVNIGTPDPTVLPVIATPADQNSSAGTPVSLTVTATDPNGLALTYSAAGLPPGLKIDPNSGVISGTPIAGGVYDVSVAASDGVNDGTTTFTWSVTGGAPLSVSIPTPPTTQAANNAITFTAASVNGVNVKYSWNFGDGTGDTAYATSPTTTHTFTTAGRFFVTVTATDDRGILQRQTVQQTIYLPATAQAPSVSSNIALQTPATGNQRLWVVNQDNDSVSVFDAVTRAKLAEIPVGNGPRTLAVSSSTGTVWVTNKRDSTLSVIDSTALAVARTIALPRGSQPFGVAMAPTGGYALVVLEGSGQLLKFNTTSYAQTAALSVGVNARHVSINAAGTTAYVSMFVTPPLPGESTATVTTAGVGGQVLAVNPGTMQLASTIVLGYSSTPDGEIQGSGVPNYVGAAVISPDGTQAWVPSKKDNILRGTLRNGLPLNFQNTLRAISSRIQTSTNLEVPGSRIDHNVAGLASAAAYDPHGNYLFVALATNKQVAIVDAFSGIEMFRVSTGTTPEGVAVSADGNTLYVNNFMDRTVGVYDLTALMSTGQTIAPLLTTVSSITTENLPPTILLGKQLFYDASDARLSGGYMSCAACHDDGGSDGRTWDFSSLGEGLRNTIHLRGRAGTGEGLMHWSGNMDEVQDFEGQIRTLAGGSGLMTDAQFNTGTVSQPLGDKKAGISPDLDALASYVGSLNQFDVSPLRNADGTLTTAAVAGATVFKATCASCHSGANFTDSVSRNIGTIKATSGNRLGGPLTGIDTPTLRDVWFTAPYLHDGSAPTVEAAIQAHNGITLSATDLTNVATYVRQIGSDEAGFSVPGVLNNVRYVKLESVSEVNGTASATAAEFNLVDSTGATVPRTNWIVTADSSESDTPPSNVIDGNPWSIWTTQWRTATPPMPHQLIVNLGGSVNLGGFRYLPGQGLNNGQIAVYNFYTSQDGVNWSMAWQGTFPNTIAEKVVMIPAAATAGVNHAPVLAPIASRVGVVGSAATLAMTATDADGDVLTYSAAGLPPGLVLNAGTGVVGGTPTTAGTYAVVAQASDGRGGTATQPFTWTVTSAVNHAPTLAAVGNPTSTAGSATSLMLVGADVDGDVLTYSATGLPAGMIVAATTGLISGAPTTPGTSAVTAQVSDGRGGVATQSFTWTVTAAATVTTVKYVKLVALTEVNGNPWTSMEEFNLIDPSGAIVPRTTWQVSADSAETDGPATNAVDGLGTIWHTQWRTASPPTPHSFTVNLGAAVQVAGFRVLPRQDGSPNGMIANYAFYTSQDGVAWALATQGTMANDFTEKTVMLAVTVNHAPTLAAMANAASTTGTAATLTLTGADIDGDALTYSATGLPTSMTLNALTGVIAGTPTVAGTFTVTAQVSDGRGGVATQSFTWTVTAAATVTTVKYVKLVALTEVNGNPWTSMEEFNLIDPSGATVPRTTWQVSADSAETDGPATNAVDGLGTIWHTQWRTASPPTPHAFTVNLGAAVQVAGFSVLPRQDGSPNGMIANYAFYTSQDGVTWTLATQGTMANDATQKTVMLAVTANHAPTLAAMTNASGTVGTATTVTLVGADVDGDALTYTAAGLPPGMILNAASGAITGTPTAAGAYVVTAQVNDGRGGVAAQSFAWTVAAAAVVTPTTTVNYVKLVALTEVNGNPWTSIQEFNLIGANGATVPRATWQVSADSAETDGPATYAVDGLGTIWHTQWRTASPPTPHALTVNLGAAVNVTGFRVLPRQDNIPNGMIANYAFYTSQDGANWTLATQGTMANDFTEKTVMLPN